MFKQTVQSTYKTHTNVDGILIMLPLTDIVKQEEQEDKSTKIK